MRYMLLLYGCDERPRPGEPGFEQALARVNAFVEECRRRGAFVGGQPLRSESTATTVRVRDGQPLLTDGPAAELREQVGGYAIIDCPDLDDALKWAVAMPAARDCSVEVRAIVDTGGGHTGSGR